MLSSALEKRVQNFVLSSVFLVTLTVTPWMSLDPINLPKFLILVVFAGAIFGSLLPEFRKVFQSDLKKISIAIFLFVISLFLTLIFSGAPHLIQLYGTFGRNTGLLTYLSLAITLLGSAVCSNKWFAQRLLWILIFVGIANSVYGLIQWMGIDPVNWQNPYNPVLGTLGNPNFVSAILGIASLAAFAFLLDSHHKIQTRLLLLAFVALSLFVAHQSDASQGYLIFGFGATIIIYFRFIKSLRLQFARFLYIATVILISLISTFGLLQKGPLSSFLYQDSVTYRGDYWRAGWEMTTKHPIFGVGLDSYGDWYRTYRTQAAALRRGPDVTSNSAHNVFIDISSNGGFLLLFAYLSIILLTFWSMYRITKRSKGYHYVSVSLFATWMAYLLQSIISINQVGLAIWGWVLSGAIIGLDFHENRGEVSPPRKVKNNSRQQVSATAFLTGVIGLFTSLILSVWPFIQDVSYANAIKSGSVEKIEEASTQFPSGNYYLVNSAQTLANNKFAEKALELARKSVAGNPRDFNAWRTLVALPNLDSEEREAGILRMKQLDPFNTTIGQ